LGPAYTCIIDLNSGLGEAQGKISANEGSIKQLKENLDKETEAREAADKDLSAKIKTYEDEKDKYVTQDGITTLIEETVNSNVETKFNELDLDNAYDAYGAAE
jgi:hypothetical protein